jgi:hypothetical protein
MTLVRPTGSYVIELPEDVCEQRDGRVSSFWLDGKPLLLQLSSFLRVEGIQIGARERLEKRIGEHPEKWKIWEKRLHPEPSVDQASAEFSDDEGTSWTHSYLVWPHLTIPATISGPEVDFRNSDSWAMVALRSLKLAVH